MDFHSLLRRDLQFLCKRNKIPANLTNVAMADALKALEIVEGLDEYMNQSNANAPQSPTSVAKQPPITATRTTRRKTTVKAEPQSLSQLVTRPCSLTGEMNQENINKNVVQEPKTNNVPKTPAARTTKKASAASSCSSKVQESNKDELVQSVYSTRRSTRLLEKCMADLSLKTKETLDKPAKNEESELKVSAQEKNPPGSEAEVIPSRDLSISMEKEWENSKSDNDQFVGDVAVSDANIMTNKEKMKEVTGDEIELDNSFVQVDKQEETLQAICEEGPEKNDNEEIFVELGGIPVLEYANTETQNYDKESKNVQAFDSLVEVNQNEPEQAVPEDVSEPERLDSFDEETMVDQTVTVAGDSKTEQAIQENDSEPEKISNFNEDDQTDGDASDSETETEEDDSGVDSDGTISEADSNQAVLGSDIADEEMTVSELEASTAAPTSPPLLEEVEVKTTPLSPFTAEPISVQFPRPSKPTATPFKNSALKMVNENKENNMVMIMNVNNNENGESKAEEGKKKKKKVTIDEESLKDVSVRQLIKMVKELSIKGNNRTALQILPANNQTAE